MVNPAKTMGLDGSRQETVGSGQLAVRIHYIIVIFHSYGQKLRTKDCQLLTAHCPLFTAHCQLPTAHCFPICGKF